MNTKIFYTLIFLITFQNVIAQEVTIPGSQIKKITSSIVQGQEYELQILLPGGHDKSDRKFPVVYLMDSQWDFPLVKSIYGQQYYDGFIPELIIVGITWGGKHPNPDSLRVRDYSPTHVKQMPQSGGAPQFLSFMKSELFPFIEKNYKADPNQRILMGCSFGGLVTLYGLLEHPDLFMGYVAASPAIGYDNASIYSSEKKYSQRTNQPQARLYMTVGDVERGVPVFTSFAKKLESKAYPNLSIRSKILENTGHSGTKSETYSRGLQYIFQRNDLSLTPDELKQYTGQYTLDDGTKLSIKEDNNHLILVIGDYNRYPLKADSKQLFYATSEFLNLKFEDIPGSISGFQLNRYNRNQYATKK